MKIEKVSRDVLAEINLDDFNRQQKITRIYVRKDETYVLEEQLGVMDWSMEKKREVAQDLIDSAYISYLALDFYRAMGADVTDNPITSIADDEPDDLQLVCPIV